MKNALYFVLLLILFSSCRTQSSYRALLYDPQEVSQLSRQLGIELSNTDIDDDRNMPLYAETSLWLGTPYKWAGMSPSGVDCSGFTYLIYQKVYRFNLPRATADLVRAKAKDIAKADLKTGDLVLFATTGDKQKISHVGIYLKNSKFIHASTSHGVIVSSLNEPYYMTAWRTGKRFK